jgi:hypothetical protein
MTPGELAKVSKQVADLLGRDSNSELTAEELADEITSQIISTYEEIQGAKYNLVVLGHFRLDDDSSYVTAVGPLSTRAVAAARGVGERFAWDWRTRRGTGKYVLVPLIRDPRDAWEAARNAGVPDEDTQEFMSCVTGESGSSYEAMRFELSDEVRRAIKSNWDVDAELLKRHYGPVCICGLPEHPRYNSLGQSATTGCPVHPEGTTGGGEGSDSAGRGGDG